MIEGELIAGETPATEMLRQGETPGGAMVPGSSVLRQGDGLGFDPGSLISLTAGDQGADLLLFELR